MFHRRKFVSLLPLVAIGVALAALLIGTDGGRADTNSNPHKALHTDQWYQRYTDTYSWASYMTLSGHAHYLSNFASDWQAPVEAALASYNDGGAAGGQHAVYLANSSPAGWHDNHIIVTNKL